MRASLTVSPANSRADPARLANDAPVRQGGGASDPATANYHQRLKLNAMRQGRPWQLMHRLARATILALALAPPAALAQQPDEPRIATAPPAVATGFISTMSVRHLFVIESADLADTRQPGVRVRALAEMLRQDHRRALAALRQATAKASLPPHEDELGSRHQAELDALREHDVTTFGAAFIALQSEVNGETIAIVERYAARGKSRPLRNYARDLLPTLQRHDEALRQMR